MQGALAPPLAGPALGSGRPSCTRGQSWPCSAAPSLHALGRQVEGPRQLVQDGGRPQGGHGLRQALAALQALQHLLINPALQCAPFPTCSGAAG